MNQSRWSQIRAAASSRRSRFIIAALVLFLASAALVSQPGWHIATSRLRMGGLNRPTPSSTPSLTPRPTSSPPVEIGNDTEQELLTAVLSPDEDNVLLSVGSPIFTSPNGRYSLTLQPDGDLVLSHDDGTGVARPLWWTGTGDRHPGGRTLSVEKHNGHVRIVINATLENTWVTVWHSDLEPACKSSPGAMARDEDSEPTRSKRVHQKTPGQLGLSDDGQLTLAGVCDLYVPPRIREKDRSLAVIVAGLYRTNHITCKTHMEKLIADHPSFSRIDVFAYIIYEPADIEVHKRTPDSIKAEVRNCYGQHLKALDVVPVAEAEMEYPGGVRAMLAPCGDRLRRLNNQLRTVSLAAEQWWAWTISNGFTHDTVLRIRPDTSFWAMPEFKSLEELGDTLVLPHPKGEHYFYCARMRGSVGIGPTDQIAYGNAASMQHWFYMYDRFAQIVDMASNPDRPASRDFSGCEDMPTGPLANQCPRPAPCSIECIVAWYLDARGVDFRIEWGWQSNPLRWKDIGMIGAEEERMADQHQADKDEGMQWA